MFSAVDIAEGSEIEMAKNAWKNYMRKGANLNLMRTDRKYINV